MTLLLLFGAAAAPPPPSGGGHGALMSDAFFKRYSPNYEVSEKWKNMKRVKAPKHK